MNVEHLIFKWIEKEQPQMVDLVEAWANMNSHTYHFDGLKKMGETLHKAFAVLGGDMQWIEMPPFVKVNEKGEEESLCVHPVLSISKRPEAKKQFLCVGHMDTVYPAESLFQKAKFVDETTLGGPGVTDMKGGLVVMLKTLEVLEQSPIPKDFGWKVLINADEELGSPSSGALLQAEAEHFDLGLVFEPCLENGHLVSARKGSGNFTLIVRGKSAHAGRDHDKGINAIDALAACVSAMSGLSHQKEGLTVNFGKIQGGTGHNVVPDLSVGSFNIRVRTAKDQAFVEDYIQKMIKDVTEKYKVTIELRGGFSAPPKECDEATLKLFMHLKEAAKELGMDLDWQESGGVCDGNRLAAGGLPTIDTFGVHGGKIHSYEEFLLIDSLSERTKLTTLFLLKWIKGEYT